MRNVIGLVGATRSMSIGISSAAARVMRAAHQRNGGHGGDNNGPGWGFVAGTVVAFVGAAIALPATGSDRQKVWAIGPDDDKEEEDVNKCYKPDVLIIGGGIVGTALACYLTKAGVRDVTLLERGSVGCEASGLSAGTIWSAGEPSAVRAEDASLFLRARSAALLEELGGCEFNRCGALDVAATPDEAKLLRADFEQQKRQGLAVEWLGDQSEIARLEPALAGGSALCATHTPLSGSVQPALATQRFAAVAAANGCAIIEDADVVSLRECGPLHKWGVKAPGRGVQGMAAKKKAAFQATTADGRVFTARHVVLAAGAAAAPLASELGVNLPVAPVKGVVCTSTAHAAPGALQKVLFDMGSRLYFSERGDGRDDASGVPAKCTHDGSGARRCRKLYGKQCGPSDSHMLLFGGDRLPGAAAKDYAVPAASSASIRANVRELLPSLQGFNERGWFGEDDRAGSWAGLMPFSQDGRPLVGPLEHLRMRGCWLAVGFGPSGIMEGPYAAKLLAGRIASHFGAKGSKGAHQNEDEADRVILANLNPTEERGVTKIQQIL